jgi:hypothetical protein
VTPGTPSYPPCRGRGRGRVDPTELPVRRRRSVRRHRPTVTSTGIRPSPRLHLRREDHPEERRLPPDRRPATMDVAMPRDSSLFIPLDRDSRLATTLGSLGIEPKTSRDAHCPAGTRAQSDPPASPRTGVLPTEPTGPPSCGRRERSIVRTLKAFEGVRHRCFARRPTGHDRSAEGRRSSGTSAAAGSCTDCRGRRTRSSR